MKLEEFDMKSWREALRGKVSKSKAAKKLGLEIHAYTRYENAGMCPKYVMLAAMFVKMVDK
jgi:hypothetical protein